jgi:hypothetical protein
MVVGDPTAFGFTLPYLYTMQVHDEYLAKQAEFRAAAAHLASVREERLREEAARAQQLEAVARQERQAAEAAAAQVGARG